MAAILEPTFDQKQTKYAYYDKMRSNMLLPVITNKPKVENYAPLLYFTTYRRKSDGKLLCLIDFTPIRVALGHIGMEYQKIEWIPIEEFRKDFENAQT